MLVAAKPRDGKKAADVKSHRLSQMGRGKKNQMAELNLADYQARKEHHRHHEMLLLTHHDHDHDDPDDDKQQQEETATETDG